ncbi:alpha/beta fold hydrolase [Saccharothrix sp. Mg75]|uniref:alpha/beta fold hydrolase n=1 Tax=Saccharothrix sp. Mg75 TaxID=3445357 RepID=UPI003EE83721
MAITHTATGTAFTVLPPPTPTGRVVLVWHLLGEPGTPEAMAATLPLHAVPAWRVYPALPVPDTAMAVHRYTTLVRTAADAVPDVLAALPDWDGTPVDVVGGSAGGHVALLTAVRATTPVRRIAVVNPAVTVPAVVAASIDAGALEHHEWTDREKAAADPLDVLAHADRITAPLLVVRGQHEYPAFRPVQDALVAAVPGARLVEVPGLAHMLVDHADEVGREVTGWLA